MGASVYVAKRGGLIMTCAATSGYRIEYDNRHLWMKLKSIKASHFANYREAFEANRLIAKGMVQPVLSATFDLTRVGEAVNVVRANLHEGKVGIRCLSPADGLGITDQSMRERVGEDKITLFERFAKDKTMER